MDQVIDTTKQVKVTDEELNNIKQLQEAYTEIIAKFGQLHVDRIKIENFESTLKENLKQLQEQEENLVKGMNQKYGTGHLDINTGLFTRSS